MLKNQDNQTPSRFTDEETVEIQPAKIQQNLSPIHTRIATLHEKKLHFYDKHCNQQLKQQGSLNIHKWIEKHIGQ